jgi:hypothetical protein
MADKIEYSRMLVKRTDQTGEVPTVPPITAVTLNQFIPTDLFVGEFFLNEVDDLLWVRTSNGILPISLSGSTGTTVPNLTQVLFQGNATNGYDIEVSAGDTIIFSGLTSGVTSQFLGIDASGNTIVSSVTPGTPNLSSVLAVGNTTGANDISVNVSRKIIGQSGLNWIQPETGDGNLEINVDNELTILGITSGVTDIVLSYDPDTKYVRYQSISGATGSSGSNGTSGTSGSSGASGTSGSSGVSGSSGTSGTSGSSGSSGESGTSGTSGSSGVSGTSGESGTSGTSGSSGSSGANGTSGSSGESGTSGTSGVSGSAGESGTSGSSGSSGTNGTSGTSGISGDALTVYDGTSGVTVSNVTGMTFSGASIVASGQNVTITITGSTDNFVPYNIAIPLNTTGNVTRYISPVEFELSDIKANVYPAPGSENLEILIQKNGTTIFSSGSVVINSGQTTNQSQDPYILSATTFNEWDSITISASTYSGATILYLNGCQEESCSAIPPSPTPTPTPTPTPAPSGDTDATAYLAAVVATGGTVDGTITAAVNTLFEDLKTAGIYSKLDVLMPMVGSTKASMLLNAVDPTNSLWGWTEYGGAVTYNVSGMSASLSSTSALSSNWTDNDLTLLTNSSGHVSIYCNRLTSVGVMLNGMLNSIGSGYSWLGVANNGGTWYGGIYDDTSNMGTTPANQTGLWLTNRTTSTNAQAYINNVATDVTNTNASRDKRGDRQAIFTLYWAGQGFTNNLYDAGVSDTRYATITYGEGLTSTEKTDLYNIITAFNTALSRA